MRPRTISSGWHACNSGTGDSRKSRRPITRRLKGLNEWDAGDDTDPPPPREWLLGNAFCRRFLVRCSAIVVSAKAQCGSRRQWHWQPVDP